MEVEIRERRKARRKAHNRRYYLKNKDKIIERVKLRYKNNRKEILDKRHDRYNTDEMYRKKIYHRTHRYTKNRRKSDETFRKRLNKITEKSHKKRSKEIKEEIIKKLGSKCQICGFDNPLVFELHHINGRNSDNRRDPNQRDYRYYHNLLNTINDIQLLCANCHRIIHAKNKN